jgi:hypothetical protein
LDHSWDRFLLGFLVSFYSFGMVDANDDSVIAGDEDGSQ